MTPSERLIARLRAMSDFPADVEFQRTRAGRHQRDAGAWSWIISSHSGGRIAGRDLFAGYSPVGELLRADKLALVPARRRATCVDFEVYDAKDIGDPDAFTNHDTIIEGR